MLPVWVWTGRRLLRVKAVFSMMMSPSSKIWGRTPMTRKIEMTVPRPRQMPIEEMAGLEDRKPIRMPAAARMVPEVMMVGNASFSASTTASLGRMVCFSSM